MSGISERKLTERVRSLANWLLEDTTKVRPIWASLTGRAFTVFSVLYGYHLAVSYDGPAFWAGLLLWAVLFMLLELVLSRSSKNSSK